MSSSTEKAEQPIYLWPKGADLSVAKAAVIDLGLPFKVRPFWFEPGKHGKVIALEPGFKHIVDHVFPKNQATMKMAVEWALGMIELPNVHTVDKKLRNVFGEGLEEVFVDDPWATSNPAVIGKNGGWEWPS